MHKLCKLPARLVANLNGQGRILVQQPLVYLSKKVQMKKEMVRNSCVDCCSTVMSSRHLRAHQ